MKRSYGLKQPHYLLRVAVPKLLLPELTRRNLFIVFLALVGSSPAAEIVWADRGEDVKTVFVVHDAWHAAIIAKKTDIPTAVLPELRDFPAAEYLEFSWGDRDYFPTPDAGIGLALKAALWSSGSILHVVGFREEVKTFFPSAKVIDIQLSEEKFQRLIKFISDSFSRPHPPAPAEARPGLSPDGRFYAAEGRFSILRTCNTWVAEAFNSAGLPVHPSYVITAANLSDQLRPLSGDQNTDP
ncbi:MAG TPA: DUF2459 domain-containing protein [Candidatus Binatia bacterium]|jgi:uncharacterized protein (TIGR02117 family)